MSSPFVIRSNLGSVVAAECAVPIMSSDSGNMSVYWLCHFYLCRAESNMLASWRTSVRSSRYELKENAPDLVVRLVVDTMIVPVAHDSDSTVVLPLFNECHLKVSPALLPSFWFGCSESGFRQERFDGNYQLR